MQASCFLLGRPGEGRTAEDAVNKPGHDGWKVGFCQADENVKLPFYESYKWITPFQ